MTEEKTETLGESSKDKGGFVLSLPPAHSIYLLYRCKVLLMKRTRTLQLQFHSKKRKSSKGGKSGVDILAETGKKRKSLIRCRRRYTCLLRY